jgi:hypothetical protein
MIFDLNIDNYTKDELLEMLELPDTYNKEFVDFRESKLIGNILNNREIDKDTKQKTINFINEAKKIILTQKNENDKKETENLKEKIYNTNFNLQSTELESTTEHMVQVRQEAPYNFSYPTAFFPGVINPLKKKTIIKNLNIDTKFRDNYYNASSTNFNVTLPLMFTNVVSMQLSALELPLTYYAISKQYGNNFFTISVNNNPVVIKIPDGNYSNNSIMTLITHLIGGFSSVDPDFASVSFLYNSTSDGLNGSGQTVVGFDGSQSNNATIEINFQANIYGNDDRSTPLPLKLGWLLGFRNGIYINNNNYISEGIVDLTGSKYLFLVVDDFNTSVNNNFYGAFNSSMLNKNILARISIQTTGLFNTALSYNTLEQNNLSIITNPREYFGPVNITSFNIQLLDSYGRIVDLNYMDYSFCLNLTTIYDL